MLLYVELIMRAVSRLFPNEPRNSLITLMLILSISVVIAPLIMGNHPVIATIFSCLMLIGMQLNLATLTRRNPTIHIALKISGVGLILLIGYTLIAKLPVWLSYVSLGLSMIFHLAIMVMLMLYLFSKRPQTEKLLCAINFYLLTGITFSYLFLITNALIPNAFNVAEQSVNSWPSYLYFSFITLTTLGYGDILPTSALAKSLVTLEAIIGVLSPTIMIARFVSTTK